MMNEYTLTDVCRWRDSLPALIRSVLSTPKQFVDCNHAVNILVQIEKFASCPSNIIWDGMPPFPELDELVAALPTFVPWDAEDDDIRLIT